MVAVILKKVVKIESLSHFIISTFSPLLHSRIENILDHKIFHSFEELLQPIGKQEQSTFHKTYFGSLQSKQILKYMFHFPRNLKVKPNK